MRIRITTREAIRLPDISIASYRHFIGELDTERGILWIESGGQTDAGSTPINPPNGGGRYGVHLATLSGFQEYPRQAGKAAKALEREGLTEAQQLPPKGARAVMDDVELTDHERAEAEAIQRTMKGGRRAK